MTTDIVLSARGLTRRFGRAVAVDGLDLDVPRGILLGLLGDNGAGKSTTIRIALGLLAATGGTIRVLGGDPAREGPRLRERIGYVPEDRRLYRHARVGRMVAYARWFHASWDAAYERSLLERFHLDPAARIGTLSRGALAKLYLLLALAPRPELLLLDEATGGIDAIARREILAGLVDLVAENGTTIVFASHALADVERVADRIVILSGGRKVEEATVEDLRARYVKFRVRFPETAPPCPDPGTAGIRSGERRRSEWLLVSGDAPSTRQFLLDRGGPAVEEIPLGFEDVFCEIVAGGRR